MSTNYKYGQDIAIKKVIVKDNTDISKYHFNCDNSYFDDFLASSPKNTCCTTIIYCDVNNDNIIGYYSLSCSGYLTIDKTSIQPAVEIKSFAMNTDYRHLPYEPDPDVKDTLSDRIFCLMMKDIYSFTENECGADIVILYSVPAALNFYKKNSCEYFSTNMLPKTDDVTGGCLALCIPL